MLLLISLLFVLRNCVSIGQIFFHYFEMDYLNEELSQKFIIKFSLEDYLPSKQYIRINLPFAIHNPLFTSPDMSVQWAPSLSLCSNDTFRPAQIFKSNLALDTIGNIYYIRILKGYEANSNIPIFEKLDSNIIYTLKIKSFEPIHSVQLQSLKQPLSPIEIQTISDMVDNFIVYNSNQNFALVQLIDKANNNIKFDQLWKNENQTQPAISDLLCKYIIQQFIHCKFLTATHHDLDIQFILNQIEINECRIKIELNEKFIFHDPQKCVVMIEDNEIVDKYVELPKSEYLCSLDQYNNNQLIVSIYNTMSITRNYRIKNRVIFPFTHSESTIKLYLMKIGSNAVISYIETTTILFATSINFDKQFISLAWGLVPQKDLPKEIALYRNPSSGLNIYNSIKFFFNIPQVNIPVTAMFRLVLKLGGGIFSLLPGSIIHNLPVTYLFGEPSIANQIQCYEDPQPPETQIICNNIGQLQPKYDYYVGLKLSFNFDAAAANLVHQNFGLTAIYKYDENLLQYEQKPIFGEMRNVENLKILNNLDDMQSNVGYDTQIIHTIQDTSSPLLDKGIQYIGVGNSQTLVIELKRNEVHFGGSSSISNTAGFNIYTSGQVITPMQNFQTSNNYCNGVQFKVFIKLLYLFYRKAAALPFPITLFSFAQPQVNLCLVQQPEKYDTLGYSQNLTTNIRFGLNDQAQSQIIYDDGLLVPHTLLIDQIHVEQHSSFFPSELTLDFYIGFIPNGMNIAKLPVLTPASSFLVNSYTVSKPNSLFSNINEGAALTHFWSSLMGGSISGQEFPSFLRIYGTLKDSAQIAQFIIFFDYLNLFPIDDMNSQYISCNSSDSNSKDQGYYYKSNTQKIKLSPCKTLDGIQQSNEHFIFQKKIIVEYNANSNQFKNKQILIPVSTIPGQLEVKITIATAKLDGTLLVVERMPYLPKAALPGMYNVPTLRDFQKILDVTKIYGANYFLRIEEKQKAKVGSVGQAIINLYHQQDTSIVPFAINSLPDQGAAFAYVGNWEFYINSLFSIKSNLYIGSGQNSYNCFNFQYYVSQQQKYGFWCPLDQSLIVENFQNGGFLTLENFKFPYITGISMPKYSYSALSTNNGHLFNFLRDDREYIFKPNLMYLDSTIVSIGEKLVKQAWSSKIGFTFNTSNPLPKNHYIIIKQESAYNSFHFSILKNSNPSVKQCELKFNDANINDFIPHMCSLRFRNNEIFFFNQLTVSSDTFTEFPIGNYTLFIRGVQVTVNPTQVQNIIIQSANENGFIIDLSNPQTLTYYHNLNIYQSSFQLGKPNFYFQTVNTISNFNISFQILNRQISKQENIIFYFQALSEAQDEQNQNNYKCHIKYYNGTLCYLFQSCKTQNFLNEITLSPRDDIIEENQVFFLVLENVKVPRNQNYYNFTARIIDYSFSLQYILQSKGQIIPDISRSNNVLQFPQIFLQKKMSMVGGKTTIQFNFTSFKYSTNFQNIIYINFPNYYSPKLTDKNQLFCTLNFNSLIGCRIEKEYLLKIYNFQETILPNITYAISIYGIAEAYIQGQQLGKFSFIFGQNDYINKNQYTILEVGEISDIYSKYNNETINPYFSKGLVVQNFTWQFSEIFQENTINFYVTFPFHDVINIPNTRTQQFVIDLGNEFKFWSIIREQLFFTVIKLNNDYTETSETCSESADRIGNRIFLKICIEFLKKFLYKITIKGIVNPIESTCMIVNPSIFVNEEIHYNEDTKQPAKFENVLFYAGPPLINSKKFELITVSSQNYWKIQKVFYNDDQTFFRTINSTEPINCYRNQFSDLLSITLESEKRVSKTIKFNILTKGSQFLESQFILNPDIPVIEPGQNRNYVRIGCVANSTPGDYPVILQASYDDSLIFPQHYFRYLPSINIRIIDSFYDFILMDNGLKKIEIQRLGFSLPLIFTLNQPLLPKFYQFYYSPPIFPLYIQIKMPLAPDIGIDFATQNQLNISNDPKSHIHHIIYRNQYALDNYINQTYTFFDVSDEQQNEMFNIKLYEFSNIRSQQYILELSKIYDNPPNLTYFQIFQKTDEAKFQIKFDQSCYIFYSLRYLRNDLNFTNNFTLKTRLGDDKVYRENINQNNFEIYGQWIFDKNSQLRHYTIDGLNARRRYQIRIQSLGLQGQYGKIEYFNFQTGQGEKQHMIRLNFQFFQSPKYQDIMRICCALCSYYSLPYHKVQSIDGIICPPKLKDTLNLLDDDSIIYQDLKNLTTNLNLSNITKQQETQYELYKLYDNTLTSGLIDPSSYKLRYYEYLKDKYLIYIYPLNGLESSDQVSDQILQDTSIKQKNQLGEDQNIYLVELLKKYLPQTTANILSNIANKGIVHKSISSEQLLQQIIKNESAQENISNQTKNHTITLDTAEKKEALQWTLTISSTFIKIGNIRFANSTSGYIWGILKVLGSSLNNYSPPNEKDIPSFHQLSAGKDADGIFYPDWQFAIQYDNETEMFLNFTIDIKPKHKYRLFYVGAEEDPNRQLNKIGEVKWVDIDNAQFAVKLQINILMILFIFIFFK